MWLVRSSEETDSQFGKRPEDRTLEEAIKNSVIIIDKHSGPTSYQISQWVKEIFSLNKTGHTGTLDPAVTGVLPVALENSVKAMPILSGVDKEYIGIMHVHADVNEEKLRETISKFIGKIKQTPPKKSAVARREREREIYFFDIVEIEGRDVLFRTGVQAGTYIRKLIHDLGQALETGAHMSELRRTRVGIFTEDQAHSLLEIKDAYELAKEGKEEQLRKLLIPIEYAIMNTKKIFVKDSAVDTITHGSPVFVGGITRIQEEIEAGETVAVYTQKDELVCIGIAKMSSEEMFKRKRGIAIRTDRVFMPIGVYLSK